MLVGVTVAIRTNGNTQEINARSINSTEPIIAPMISKIFVGDTFCNHCDRDVSCVFQLEFCTCWSLIFFMFSHILFRFPSSPVCIGITVQQSSPITSHTPRYSANTVSIINLFCMVISKVACNCSLTPTRASMVQFMNLCWLYHR